MTAEILQVDQLSLSYDNQKEVLQNISFSVRKGEFVSLIGHSGCGKSSLLNAVAGFISPTSGTIYVNGQPVLKPGPDRAVVFQDLALFPWLSVIDNVTFGLKMQGLDKEKRLSRSRDALRMVGLLGAERARISDLSGGMRQRVALARTLVTEPEILLLDEPFSALDEQTREQLQTELMRIQYETGMSVILITHSIEEAVFLSDRVFVMHKEPGRISRELEIQLHRPRSEEIRVTPAFNEYRRRLMEELRQGFIRVDEIDGSGI